MILYYVPISKKYKAFSVKKKNGPFPEEEIHLTTNYMNKMPHFTHTQEIANLSNELMFSLTHQQMFKV